MEYSRPGSDDSASMPITSAGDETPESAESTGSINQPIRDILIDLTSDSESENPELDGGPGGADNNNCPVQMESQEDEVESDQARVLLISKAVNPEFLYQTLYRRNEQGKAVPLENPLYCWKCPTALESLGKFLVHEDGHGKDYDYKCQECDYTTDSSETMLQHVELHKIQLVRLPGSLDRQVRPVPKFSRAGRPLKQMSKFLSELPSERTIKSTLNSKDKHVTKRTLNGRCNSAQKVSTSAGRLSDRLQKRMEARRGNPEIVYKKPRCASLASAFKCLACPYTTHSYYVYKKHSGYHRRKSKCFCTFCDYSCKRPGALKFHVTLHMAEAHQAPRSHTPRQPNSLSTPNPVDLLLDDQGSLHIDEPTPIVPVKAEPVSPSGVQLGGSSAQNDDRKNTRSADPPPNRKYLVKQISLVNFMNFTNYESPSLSGAVSVNSELIGGKGKTSLLIGLMLGLGYDLLDPSFTPPTICGQSLHDLIKSGSEESTIQLTLSLHDSWALRKKYGPSLLLSRTLTRRPPLLAQGSFEVGSGSGPGLPLERIGIPELRDLLKELQIRPEFQRLMLLDNENLDYLIRNPDAMYKLYEDSLLDRRSSLQAQQKKLSYLAKRLKLLTVETLRTELEMLDHLLKEPYPDGLEFEALKRMETTIRDRVACDYQTAFKEYQALEGLIDVCQEKVRLSQLPASYAESMQEVFSKFLLSQRCHGGIVIDEGKGALALWVRSMSRQKEPAPRTLLEAQEQWAGARMGERHQGVIGLYFALWSIPTTVPVFAVDAYSGAEMDFRIPSGGIPLLRDLIQEKAREGIQYFASARP